METTQTFTLEVTDLETGCVVTDEVVVQVTGGPLSVSVSANPAEICAGESSTLDAVVSGGSGQYEYSWSEGSSSASINVSPDETTTYTVIVDDGFAQEEADVTITVNALPVADAGDDQYLCFGEELLEHCAEEVDDAVYQWNSLGTNIEGRCADLTEGQWIVEVTDTLRECQATDTMLVEELDEILITIFPDTTFEVTGGLKPYASLVEVSGDTIRVQVTDDNGCMATASLVITSSHFVPEALSFQVFPNPASDRLQIQGMSTPIQRIELWDLNGQRLVVQHGAQRILRLKDIAGGLYILRIYDNRGRVGERQVVIVR